MSDRDDEDTWLTTAQLAERLHQPEATIRFWRKKGYGPPGTLFGRRVLYRLSSVRAWETAKEREQAEARRAS